MHINSMYFSYEFNLISDTLVPQDKMNVKKGCKNFIIQFYLQFVNNYKNDYPII